jgi:hypothetical protein
MNNIETLAFGIQQEFYHELGAYSRDEIQQILEKVLIQYEIEIKTETEGD